jgi:hypothetical protein
MLTVLFSFSFLVIAFLLGFKVFENKVKRQTFVTKALSKFDDPISRHLETGRVKFEKGVSQAVAFVNEKVPSKTKELISISKNVIQDKYATMLPNIRGHRTLSQNGKVSEFLKDISKHKEENGGGRIEEGSTYNEPPTTSN